MSRVKLFIVVDSLKVVNKVAKGYPIFQTKVPDPYPRLNGGQQLGARGLSDQTVT